MSLNLFQIAAKRSYSSVFFNPLFKILFKNDEDTASVPQENYNIYATYLWLAMILFSNIVEMSIAYKYALL